MTNSMTAEEWEATLGRQLRGLRLRQNVDQRRLAEQAGVALNVVKNLEAGKGATVKSLVKVLRALGRAEWMDSLAPAERAVLHALLDRLEARLAAMGTPDDAGEMRALMADIQRLQSTNQRVASAFLEAVDRTLTTLGVGAPRRRLTYGVDGWSRAPSTPVLFQQRG